MGLMSRSVLYLFQRSIICLAGCKSGRAVMFQINWKAAQSSQVPGGHNPLFGFELNLLQAGAGLDELPRALLT